MAILDIEEAASYLKMCRRSLETLVRAGQIPGTQIAGKWLFSERQLVDYVETLSIRQTKVDTTHPSTGKTSPVKKRRRNAGYDFSNQ
jgi:excisionase family DNA binding protein